jgi:hypothetical protein
MHYSTFLVNSLEKRIQDDVDETCFSFSFFYKDKKKLLQNNSRDSKKVLDRFILYYLHCFQIKFRIVITSISFSLNWRNISFIYIYRERERERERERGFFADRSIVPHLVGHKNIYDFICN